MSDNPYDDTGILLWDCFYCILENQTEIAFQSCKTTIFLDLNMRFRLPLSCSNKKLRGVIFTLYSSGRTVVGFSKTHVQALCLAGPDRELVCGAQISINLIALYHNNNAQSKNPCLHKLLHRYCPDARGGSALK